MSVYSELELLFQAARISPRLREAVENVRLDVTRLQKEAQYLLAACESPEQDASRWTDNLSCGWDVYDAAMLAKAAKRLREALVPFGSDLSL